MAMTLGGGGMAGVSGFTQMVGNKFFMEPIARNQ
jgi:hypothetical protein